MKRKGLWGGLIASFVVLATCVGTCFGLFYVDTPASANDETGIVIDDIEENYALKDNNQQASWFDVYFFVQENAASYNGSPLNYQLVQNTASGYWESPVLASGVTTNNATYGWRKITVYRSISVDQFNSIGQPMTTKEDDREWEYGFSGWTANRQAAIDCINNRQGNFDYIDAFSSLTLLDQQTSDGSEAGDGVIFLYPIITTGKNYNKNTLEQQPIVEFIDNNYYVATNESSRGELFFSQEGTFNNSTYRYNNLTVTQDDLNSKRYSFRISQLGGGGVENVGNYWWDSYESQNTTGWTGDWYTYGSQLFELPGTYNITVKVFMDAKNFGLDRSGSSSNLQLSDIESQYGTIGSFINKEDAVTVNALTMSDDTSCPFFAYVLVERVYEFHLMGGPYETFNYNDPSVRSFYDGDIFTNGYTVQANNGEFVTTYGLNNVYIDASGRTFENTYVGNPGNTSSDYSPTGIFKTNVFTVDAQNLIQSGDQFWSNSVDGGITAFTDDELNNLRTSGEQQSYYTIGTAKEGETIPLLQEASARVNEDDTDWDYSLQLPNKPGYSEAYRTMLKINQTGYYDFRLIVTFKRSIDEQYEDNIVNYVSKIQLAVAHVISHYFIKVFVNNSFDVHGAQGSTSGSEPFITHDFTGQNSQGNYLLYTYDFQELSGTLKLDDKVFVPADGSGTTPVSLNDIANKYNKSIYDHVTGSKIVGNLSLSKNYVLYLG